MTVTSTRSPGETVSRGSRNLPRPRREAWRSPCSGIPMSTNAPNEVTFVTTPWRTSPFCRSSRRVIAGGKVSGLVLGAPGSSER
jgi:hypothetical protein